MAKKSQFKESFLLIPGNSGVNPEKWSSAIILEGKDYPFLNIQVIPTTPADRASIHKELLKTHGFVIEAPGREDFCVVQAGGGRTIEVNRKNYREVILAIRRNLEDAAAYWAENHPKKDY